MFTDTGKWILTTHQRKHVVYPTSHTDAPLQNWIEMASCFLAHQVFSPLAFHPFIQSFTPRSCINMGRPCIRRSSSAFLNDDFETGSDTCRCRHSGDVTCNTCNMELVVSWRIWANSSCYYTSFWKFQGFTPHFFLIKCRAPPKITRNEGYHLNFLRFFKATAQDGSDLLGPKVRGMGCGMIPPHWFPPMDSKTFQLVWLKVERLMWMFPKIVLLPNHQF